MDPYPFYTFVVRILNPVIDGAGWILTTDRIRIHVEQKKDPTWSIISIVMVPYPFYMFVGSWTLSITRLEDLHYGPDPDPLKEIRIPNLINAKS